MCVCVCVCVWLGGRELNRCDPVSVNLDSLVCAGSGGAERESSLGLPPPPLSGHTQHAQRMDL